MAVDNGAYSCWINKREFDHISFLKLLLELNIKRIVVDFVIVPDIVAGGLDSLAFSLSWVSRLGDYRRYLAVQDGMEEIHLPHTITNQFDGVFVGGSPRWKWQTAKRWVEFAHSRGKKLHIGKCGTWRRLLYAQMIGADSVDSTNFARNDSYNAILKYQAAMRGGSTCPK